MKQQSFVLMCCFFVGVEAAQAAFLDEMLDQGQTTHVFEDRERGVCVATLGFADATGKKVKDLEIARTIAMSELSAFVHGRNVESRSRSRVEVKDNAVFESFYSQVQQNAQGFLQGAEVAQSGKYQGQVYVLVQACQKGNGIQALKDIRTEAQANVVKASGVGPLTEGHAKARQIAIDDALRNAVSQYYGVKSLSESTVQNGEDLSSRQATRSSGAVTRYQIVKETTLDGVVRVEVLAELGSVRASRGDTNKVIRESMGRPAIYLNIADPLAKNAFRELFVQADFDLTQDKKQARYLVTVDTKRVVTASLENTPGRRTSLTIRIQDRFGADDNIVIQNNPNESIEVSDIPRLRSSRSMRYAVDSVRRKVLAQLTKEMNDQYLNGAKVLVTFTGFDRLRDVENLKQLLASFPLTKQVTLRPVDGGKAYLDVLYLGDPNELQIKILKAAPNFRLNGLRAKNRGSQGLDFTF